MRRLTLFFALLLCFAWGFSMLDGMLPDVG